MMGYYYGTNWGTMMGGFGFFGLLMMVLVIAFLVLGIMYFWKQLKK